MMKTERGRAESLVLGPSVFLRGILQRQNPQSRNVSDSLLLALRHVALLRRVVASPPHDTVLKI
ncbi:hypothetical protein SBA2_450039 [Acidobacteriia bacterium SbA2]|nr:hypothetical protein SBA2_450039 [Acidobacteriia bacterium SbA2]